MEKIDKRIERKNSVKNYNGLCAVRYHIPICKVCSYTNSTEHVSVVSVLLLLYFALWRFILDAEKRYLPLERHVNVVIPLPVSDMIS